MTPQEARETIQLRRMFLPDWRLMDCQCLSRKRPCKHELERAEESRAWQAELERLEALTDDDLAWLTERGWMPSPVVIP